MPNKNNKLKRAMLVPYMEWEGEIYFLCMRPSNSNYGGTNYQFCKGRIDSGETSKSAAIREAIEELGINPNYASPLIFVDRVMDGTCDLYICEYNYNSYPKNMEETLHTAFLSEQEFMLIGRNWQKPIAKMIANFIKEQKLT